MLANGSPIMIRAVSVNDDQAMIVTVPASDAPYQGIQLGSMWYISTDFINHQTSLTANQARIDNDGKIRFVISERDPGVANWLECTGHRRDNPQHRPIRRQAFHHKNLRQGNRHRGD